MRINRISDATKIIIFAATIIVVCVLCALGFKMANEGKAAVASGTNKFNNMASKQDDTELSAYDGTSLLGSQLVDLIKKTIDDGDCLSIEVITLSGTACYNYTISGAGTDTDPYKITEITNKVYAPNTTDPDDKNNPNYINPSSEFMGNAKKDINGNIIALSFKQLK